MSAGMEAHPAGTLVDVALRRLGNGPLDSMAVCRDVLSIPRAPLVVAERLATALLGADPRVRRLGDGRWMRVESGASSPDSPDLNSCVFAVVDVETTGGRARSDRITEIGVAVVRGDSVELVFESLVNPGRAIPRFVSAVTRITDAMVRDRPPFSAIAEHVLHAVAGRVFVAHNIGFDWRFLGWELRRCRSLALAGPRLCTLDLARRLIPGMRSRSLDTLAEYFGVAIEPRHRAGPDALGTAKVLRRLLDIAVDSRAHTLHDLREIDRRQSAPRSAGPMPVNEI
jgi:DNA polymerase-3 subunit epsilon